MKKVKIITDINIDKLFPNDIDYEVLINQSLKQIQETGGLIIKIQYCTSLRGYLKTVIIEYESSI